MTNTKIIFDQYSRYKACADLLFQSGYDGGDSVLDIGSGPECLFGRFLLGSKITFLDPLIPPGSEFNAIRSDIFSEYFQGKKYDFVTAVDVYEHINPSMRKEFISRINSLASKVIVLAFPSSQTKVAADVDKSLIDQYHDIYNKKYSWLEEHQQYGLPSVNDVKNQLESFGWHCQVFGHGHVPWLTELLGFLICAWEIPEMKEFCLQVSQEFNEKLYEYDFEGPHYREFIVASKDPFEKEIKLGIKHDNSPAKILYKDFLNKAKSDFFKVSLVKFIELHSKILDLNQLMNSKLADKDSQIIELNQLLNSKLADKDSQIIELNQLLNSKLAERDAYINNINKSVEEVSLWAKSLETDLIHKNIEAVKVSDWALQLLKQLDQRRESLPFKIFRRARLLASKSRGLLSRTPIGDAYKSARYYFKRFKKHTSLKVIRASVDQNEGRLIIAFPIITWEFRWQRPQHILSGLRDAGYSILYLAISLLPSGRKFGGASEAIAHVGFSELEQHINQIWLNSSENVNVYTDAIEGDDLHNIVLGLGAVIKSAQPKSIIYMIQFPGWSPVALKLKEEFGGKIIFDCMDDHAGFTTNTKSALDAEINLIRSADLVIASSNLLEEKVSQLTNRVIQVKNATEFDHFNRAVKNIQLNQYAVSPIIGYYGAISDWFDMELIAYCATVRPEWNFVLIGSTFGADLHLVKALSNVHFLGEIPYAELPGYLAHFDVCTIPFKLIPLTLATNPVKFYEYLSAGKPVVSIKLPELVPYDADCYLAKNTEEFLAQIELALRDKDDPLLIARRLNLARENSWGARVNCILQSPALNIKS